MQQNSSTGRLVRSKVKWASHMVRMDADILVKRVEEKGEKTSRMQEKGNEQLRSKDCVRWDMRRSGEDERWERRKMKDGEGAADRKLCKEKTERVKRQYFT